MMIYAAESLNKFQALLSAYNPQPLSVPKPLETTTMSNVFFYEPFYDLDRFVEQAFNFPSSQNQRNRQLAQRGEANGAVRSLKPRYVIEPGHHCLMCTDCAFVGWTFTKTRRKTLSQPASSFLV